MDQVSRGIATAALALQSAMLQALIHKGVLTPEEALKAIDESLDAVMVDPGDEDALKVSAVARSRLEKVQEGLAAMLAPSD